MKKTGPCCHCGVTSTPLWRNGPPDKPILCNACGSRWRTKGSLTNYTPLHARELFELEELKATKVKNMSCKPKEQKLRKRKLNSALDSEHELKYCDQNYQKMVEAEATIRSSCGPAGSAISCSESCARFGTNDASDVTGSAQSNVCDPLVNSKKSSFVTRSKPSPVEMLTKELYSIWHEQQSSNLSGCSEDDLLYESVTQRNSSEIGYGTVLIRHPCSKSVEEESEASSLPLEKKACTRGDAYVPSASFPVNTENTGAVFSNIYNDKLKESTEKIMQGDAKRKKVQNEKYRMLCDRESPLVAANLIDVVNFEAFMKFLTLEEQQKLMKYLPSVDTSQPPESIKNVFMSSHFLEAIPCFQHLLKEGVFDLSSTLANAEECRNLRSYIISGLKRSEWLECHKSLKDEPSVKTKEVKELTGEQKSTEVPKLVSVKRSCDTHIYSEMKDAVRSPKRRCTFVGSNANGTDGRIPKAADMKSSSDANNLVEDKRTCSSPGRFSIPLQDSSSMCASFQFTADSSDELLLVDMPSSASFAEAELLCPLWKEKITPHNSAVDSGLAEGEESRSSFSILQAKNG